MVEIKPDLKNVTMDTDSGQWFDPYNSKDAHGRIGDGVTPRCICGYTLHKESEDTWRCAGGNHRYTVKEGTLFIDKFGNVWIKSPK